MKQFGEFNIEKKVDHFVGEKIPMKKVINKEIIVHSYLIKPSIKKENAQCLHLQVEVDGVKRVIFTGSPILQQQIKQVPKDGFPFKTTVLDNDHYEFT